jgi:hypothetical protein
MAQNDAKAQLGLYDRESEDLLLAAVLKSDAAADDIIPRVQMEMFGDIVSQYIYGAAVELRRHGYAVTTDGVIAKARELAGKNRLRSKEIVRRPAVDRLLAINIEGADMIARATTVANTWILRGYIDDIEGLVETIAQRPEPDVVRRQLMALLSAVNMRQQAQSDGIYYGFDAGARLDKLIDELDAGRLVRFSWPWEAFDFVAPLPPGFCALWGMPDGTGKCLGGGTKVLMYDGSLRAVEEVSLGDLLMGPDSTPRRVLEISRGRAPLYRVRQNRGVDYSCTGNHLLAVQEFSHGDKRRRTVRADHLASLSPKTVRSTFQGYKVAVEWPERDLPLDPYFFGVWLGDGKSSGAVVYTPEPEIIAWLNEYAAASGCAAKVRADNERGTCMSVSLNNGRSRPSPIHAALRGLGVLGDKHIPQVYLINSRAVRLQLLAGLLDTDGYYAPAGKGYEITQKSERLAHQIKFLADSLGFSTRLTSKRAVITSRNFSCTVWRLVITGEFSDLPMRVPRKRPVARTINKDPRVTGIAVELDGEGDYYGFTLNGDQCFLLEDMTVTHNSSSAETVSRHNARLNYTVAYVATEYEQDILDQRILSQISGLPVGVIMRGGYDAATRKVLRKARDFYDENYRTLHYVSGSGLSMPQIIGKIHSLSVKPDLVVMDYLQDIAFDRQDGNNETARGNNAMRNFHAMLKSIGCAGLVVSQFVKTGYGVTDPSVLSRTLLNLGAPALSKSQCTIIAVRNRLENDGDDLDWDENGVVLKEGIGRRGKHERILRFNVDKQTLGDPGDGFLDFTSNQVVRDLPPRVVEYLGGRVSVRDPQPEEKTLMKNGY